jgi:hypothetical protein
MANNARRTRPPSNWEECWQDARGDPNQLSINIYKSKPYCESQYSMKYPVMQVISLLDNGSLGFRKI